MIGKLIVHGPTRAAAIARMRQALNEFKIGPLRTTIALLKRIMDNATTADKIAFADAATLGEDWVG